MSTQAKVLSIRLLFALSAVYDGVLGAVFLIAPQRMFAMFGVTPPNHYGYVQFPAALLMVFSVMFAAIATNPQANRKLIPYGIGLKIAYSAIVFVYWARGEIPAMWKPFAVCDAAFALAFAWGYVILTRFRRR